MNQAIVLLARTPVGDGAFVRLGDGAVWMIDPYHSRLSCAEEVQRAIRDLEFVAVGSTHPDWPDLGRVLEEVAAEWRKNRSRLGVDSYSVDTLIEILDDVEASGDDNHYLALTLLSECPASKDEAVYSRILALLEPRVSVMTAISAVRHEVARERVLQKLVA